MFVRDWLRAVAGAGSAGLVVPAGLVLAIVAAATIGGASLGGLGQLFAGPSVPGTRGAQLGTAQVREGTIDRDVPAVPTRRAPATRRSTAARSGGSRSAAGTGSAGSGGTGSGTGGSGGATQTGSAGSGGSGSGGSGSGSGSGSGTSSGGTGGTATPGTTPATTPPASTPPATPTTETNPVRRLGQGLQSTLDPVLPPVGPGLSDAVGTVIDLVAPPGS